MDEKKMNERKQNDAMKQLTFVARMLVLKVAEPGMRLMFHLSRVIVALNLEEAKLGGRQAYRQQ